MSYLTIAWSFVAGVCGAIGVAHLGLGVSRSEKRSHLLFAIAAFAASANALAELAAFEARTVSAYTAAHRTMIAAVGVLFVSIVWYAVAYTGMGRRSLAVGVTAAWTAVLVVDAFRPFGPVFAPIAGLRTAHTPWGERFSVPVGRFEVTRHLLDAADVLLGLFLLDLFLKMWRSGNRRRVLRMAVGIGVLLTAGLVQVRLVDQGFLEMPHVASFIYLAVVTMAGYPLTADVVRVAEMAGKLRESELGLTQSRKLALLSAEEAQRAEAWFRRVFDATRSAMIVAGPEGRIRLANSRAESLFGYALGELVGRPVGVLFANQGRLRSVDGPRGAPIELSCRRRDGAEIPAEVEWSEVPSAEGRYDLLSIVDITERRRSELELARQRNELAHLSRLTTIGELAGSLAHELNQPLTAILANAQAAQRMIEQPAADLVEVGEILRDIAESDRHAGEVIGRLRTMLRKGEENIETLDVTEIVQDALRLARSDLLNHGVVYTADLAAGLPSIEGDRVQLLQVLLNLVLNGIDAVAEEPPERRRLLFGTAMAEGDGPAVHVSVADSGPGVPEELMEQIFDPFFTTKTTGMGLGLSVCRSIVTAHGGTIHVTNDRGRGATFHLVLPCRPKSRGNGENAQASSTA